MRAQLLFTPNENLEIIGRFEWSEDDIDGYSPDYAPTPDNPVGFDRIVEQNFDDYTERETRAGSLEINYDFGNGYTLTSLTGLQSYDSSNFRDIDMSPLDFLNTTSGPDSQDQFSQELRIASPVTERFDWIAGAYYFEQEADTTFTASLGSIFTGGPPSPFFLVGLGESKTKAWVGVRPPELPSERAVDRNGGRALHVRGQGRAARPEPRAVVRNSHKPISRIRPRTASLR